MRGLTQEDFASSLSESCLSVWIDDISGFGTFPLEAMKSGVPVIGKIPTLKPEWMTDDNGIWTIDNNQIIDLVAAVFKSWLEDRIPTDLYEQMEKTANIYTEEKFTKEVLSVFDLIRNSRIKTLKATADKFLETENQ